MFVRYAIASTIIGATVGAIHGYRTDSIAHHALYGAVFGCTAPLVIPVAILWRPGMLQMHMCSAHQTKN